MEQHESMGKGILIPADVTGVHEMFRFARSKPDWCTELGKAFTMAGYPESESCDNWGWVPEPTVVICSTFSLRAVNKELTPLIILLTRTLSSLESPVDELRLA